MSPGSCVVTWVLKLLRASVNRSITRSLHQIMEQTFYLTFVILLNIQHTSARQQNMMKISRTLANSFGHLLQCDASARAMILARHRQRGKGNDHQGTQQGCKRTDVRFVRHHGFLACVVAQTRKFRERAAKVNEGPQFYRRRDQTRIVDLRVVQWIKRL